MSDEFEAAGAAIEGGLLAKAVEDESGDPIKGGAGQCLNCKSPVDGNFCTNCGQPLHVHRSIGALWHDILHGVLHFEGKFWRTLPLLAWKPGDLTRRYIHGERAKFISPMALFLFSIFMMFAVFSFMGDPFSSIGDSTSGDDGVVVAGVATQAGQIDGQIKAKEAQLPQASGSKKEELEREILDLKKGRNMLASFAGEEKPYPEVKLSDGDTSGVDLSSEDIDKIEEGIGNFQDGEIIQTDEDINTGFPDLDKYLKEAFNSVNSNPDLLLYKLKANGYKFAWLLIPISVPFVWLTMIGRRGFRFYDHAVFATYSIAFMSLLFIFCAALAAIGVSEEIWVLVLVFYPPIHMYRQLRHAYDLSRPEALVRVIFLFLFTLISILIFFLILLALGVLG